MCVAVAWTQCSRAEVLSSLFFGLSCDCYGGVCSGALVARCAHLAFRDVVVVCLDARVVRLLLWGLRLVGAVLDSMRRGFLVGGGGRRREFASASASSKGPPPAGPPSDPGSLSSPPSGSSSKGVVADIYLDELPTRPRLGECPVVSGPKRGVRWQVVLRSQLSDAWQRVPSDAELAPVAEHLGCPVASVACFLVLELPEVPEAVAYERWLREQPGAGAEVLSAMIVSNDAYSRQHGMEEITLMRRMFTASGRPLVHPNRSFWDESKQRVPPRVPPLRT